MQIRLDKNTEIDPYVLAEEIRWFFETQTRFTLENGPRVTGKKKFTIHTGKVRLKDPKQWCGSHPFACEIGQNRQARFLEGADFVEFNDLLNDILDKHDISAYVFSAVCELRRGTCRRISYDGHYLPGPRNDTEWDKAGAEDDYEDWCGQIAPNSMYPEGTPGIYARR